MSKITAKKILIKYLENKNFLVYYLTKGKYQLMDERDFDEVLSWSEELCKNIIQNLHTGNDSGLCPYCILYLKYKGCKGCNYGYRHGNCKQVYDMGYTLYQMITYDMGYTLYQMITEELGQEFISYEEFLILVEEAKNLLICIR